MLALLALEQGIVNKPKNNIKYKCLRIIRQFIMFMTKNIKYKCFLKQINFPNFDIHISVPKFRSPNFDPQVSIPKFRSPNFDPQISVPKFRSSSFDPQISRHGIDMLVGLV